MGCVWYAHMNFTMKALAAAALEWHHVYVIWDYVVPMLWLYDGYIIYIICYGCCYCCCVSQERNCYGCHASQKRISMSAVPMALQVFFQPLSSCLAYPEFSEQCEQKDNWHYEQDQQYDWYSWQNTQQVGKTEPPQKSRQDTQQVEEPEAPLDEGQWPPYSMWYHVAMISWCGLYWKTGSWWMVHWLALKQHYRWWVPICRTRQHRLPLAPCGKFSWLPIRQIWIVSYAVLHQCVLCRDAWKN